MLWGFVLLTIGVPNARVFEFPLRRLARRTELEKVMTKMYMFSSARKMMSALVELPGGGHRLYVKGASEMIVSKAVRANVNGSEAPLTDALQGELADQILAMANRALRTIGIAHRDFASLDGCDLEKPLEQLGELVLDAIVGIIDPLRGDVKAAVAQCQSAGIMARQYCLYRNVCRRPKYPYGGARAWGSFC